MRVFRVSLPVTLGAWSSLRTQDVGVEGQFNAPPGVETWCGKAYKNTTSSFDPGGRMTPPPKSSKPLFNLRVYPQMSIYLSDETTATLIIDASLSYTQGTEYCAPPSSPDGYISSSDIKVQLSILHADTKEVITSNKDIPFNTTGNELPIPLSAFPPRFKPYPVLITTSTPHCGKTFTANTTITNLPVRTDGGSTSRIDNLHSGLQFRNTTTTPATWQPIFPYSFYVNWGDYLANSKENITKFIDNGYNIIHPTPDGGNNPWDWKQFNDFLDIIEERGMWLMYDMRWTFKNLTSVAEQVNRFKARKSVLLWYTGDEPDGQGDAFNSTVLADGVIKSIDPYHPNSLVLNCLNYYYGEYAAGADIIMADPYPIGQNATFSTLWYTPCNATYGDCGCDDCEGNFRDVSTRMDTLQKYQSWVGGGPKSFWGVPQAFGGSEYWSRPPTAMEEVVMAMLFVNHNAKGIVAWNFPTTEELTRVTGALARTLTTVEVTGLLLGAKTVAVVTSGSDELDAASWRVGNNMLVSVVYMGKLETPAEVVVKIQKNAKRIQQVWPVGEETKWKSDGFGLKKEGLRAMEVALLVVELDG
ncbi:hypothetical protein EJ08DRAFT_587517 [Tothia fuscella]|uniref:Glycoside hydrolase subgroup catalytic core protein n=1 Tax=Tothia fuscella TaxID=1048955 RepID=A0A9P4NTE0_9PEZI|nr:hypothetical protein EJ08DRAFT_587517 [Tothia fuscella]